MSAEATAVTPSAEFDCAICGARLDLLHLEMDAEGSHCSFCGSPQDVSIGDDRTVPSRRSIDVGETLRRGRIVRGETLEQAARFTRIRLSYLRELERGDPRSFEPYPGRVYARFFLREYADHLGLDPAPLVRGFDVSTEPVVTPMPPAPRAARPAHQRRWAIGAAALLVALLITGAFLSPPAQERGIASTGSPAIGIAAGLHPHGHEGPTATSPASPLRAMIATSRDCWILATVDGTIALQETVPAGETIRLEATRTLDLRLGDAGAAGLRVNGRPIRTGGTGEVADLSFAWRNGRLVLL